MSFAEPVCDFGAQGLSGYSLLDDVVEAPPQPNMVQYEMASSGLSKMTLLTAALMLFGAAGCGQENCELVNMNSVVRFNLEEVEAPFEFFIVADAKDGRFRCGGEVGPPEQLGALDEQPPVTMLKATELFCTGTGFEYTAEPDEVHLEVESQTHEALWAGKVPYAPQFIGGHEYCDNWKVGIVAVPSSLK